MLRFRKQLVWNLVALMVTSPALSYAQQTTRTKKIETSYVTPGAFVAAFAHPRRVLTAPEMEVFPLEVISALGKQQFGIDPVDVEEVIAIVEPPQQGPPEYGVVLRLAKPFQLDALTLPPTLPLADAQLEGRPYRQSQNPFVPGFYMPDDRTLLVATDAFLKKLLANRENPVDGPLSRLLAKVNNSSDALIVAMVEPIRPMLSAQLSSVPLPPPLEGVKRLPELIDAAKADLSVTGKPGASLVLLSSSQADAEELAGVLNQLLDFGQQMALSQIDQRGMQGDDPVQRASVQYSQRITRRMIESLRPKREGKTLRVRYASAGSMQIATIGILVSLTLPAVQGAREAARRMQSSNNLKSIAIAMHNYRNVHKTFPARANFDANGKPQLSWRVHLLPFLEQTTLYKQFHLDEAWDSAHNKRLIESMPDIYRNPSSNSPPNMAHYLLPTGPGSIFEGQEGASLAKIRDGATNTILALEVNNDASVIWTKPDDFNYTAENPLQGLGTAHPGGFNAAFSDGSIRFIAATTDPENFLRMLMMADGQPVRF